MESSLGRRSHLRGWSRCAQHLAASMESSPVLPECPGAEPAVPNALRHQWNPHKQIDSLISALIGCSTPCGNNGILTQTLPLPDTLLISAQRLAATMESSHAARGIRASTVTCSTPCGNNGILTRRSPPYLAH